MRLIRIANTEAGIFGVLLYKEIPLFVTLENQWRDNTPFISCIPEGVYHCDRIESPRFGNTFEVINVPGRTSILFHAGNVEPDTTGCILLAMSYGMLHNTPAITNSRVAMGKFLDILKDTEAFSLIVSDRTIHPIAGSKRAAKANDKPEDNNPLSESPIG